MIKLELKSIKGKKKFDIFFQSAKKFYLQDAAIFVSYKKCEANDRNNLLEFALSVRKKNARKAVVRNRIKRLLRECLREFAKNDAMSEKLLRFDKVLIVWANAPKHPMLIKLDQVCPVVEQLIDKAYNYNVNR